MPTTFLENATTVSSEGHLYFVLFFTVSDTDTTLSQRQSARVAVTCLAIDHKHISLPFIFYKTYMYICVCFKLDVEVVY